ncbi:MAG: PepSY-associated TM helix domain-containing protein [Sphingobacteriales bacterium]|nr:MAG: PepSY-associated TM helix domain-containing protein [Sphingobacteriales bacterium]
MPSWNLKRIRRLNIATHRDLGYFFSTLILIYCISGIALNHVDDWNPDFILTKKNIELDKSYTKEEINQEVINRFGKLVGETNYKVFDFPTQDQVKIYYRDASLHIYLSQNNAIYEQVSKRPLIYQSNVLHRNSLKGWKWASDIFAVLLIVINITGLFILKGKYGISGRGKWLIAAGFIPPFIALIIQSLL